MHCSSKITFDYELKRFYNEFKDIECVVIYTQSGWANHGMPWDVMGDYVAYMGETLPL